MLALLSNKYIVYAGLALIAIAVGFTYFKIWEANLKQQALLEFNNTQLEQVVAEQKKFNENLKALSAAQKVVLETMNKNNEELANRLQPLEEYLNSDEAVKESKGSSEVLKKTIRGLGGK